MTPAVGYLPGADAESRDGGSGSFVMRRNGQGDEGHQHEHDRAGENSDQRRQEHHRVPAQRGQSVARRGAGTVRCDGERHGESWHRRAVAHSRATADPHERGAALRWGQSWQQINNASATAGLGDHV
jgi:hypothetical protein